ncbi:MAG: RNA polymerase sigma factor [Marinilabiliales bacterium]|nr:RNA polymerase sigma factor [Marinilabiliales bacterium]
MIDKELRGHIRREISRLAPKLRDALLLASAGEHSYSEIAGMLGIPVGTLKWRVNEARRRLKARLAGGGSTDSGLRARGWGLGARGSGKDRIMSGDNRHIEQLADDERIWTLPSTRLRGR